MTVGLRAAATSGALQVGGVDAVTFDATGITSGAASQAGNAAQVFSVGPATAAAHAVRADQIQGASLTAFTTGGTGTAFTLTPSPAITAYTANQTFDVIFNAACGAAPTLQISGVATPPNLVRQLMDGSYQNLVANDFPAGWQSSVKLVSTTQALVLKLPPRTFIGNATIDLTLASGTQAITGVGFKPKYIEFMARKNATLIGSDGWSNGAANHCVYTTAAAAGSADSVDGSNCISFNDGSGNYKTAIVQSLDVNGFTLSWTKTGSPTGTGAFVYMARE